jgi:uncharacterized damage-inducible protein DinB
MTRPLLDDGFRHHVWASLRVFDACLALEPAQLDTTVPGTYGSIIDTLRHLVAGDCGYLFALTGGRTAEIDEERMELAALRERMEANGAEWAAVVAEDIDPDADIVRHREDGIDSHAPFGIRLAQALHHGTDHRSQICTALSSLGVTPPEIDVWEFADQDGKLSETTAAS